MAWWRLANSLIQLRNEVNEYAPNRSKVRDGTIGDAAHASRPSRHNPNNYSVVCALDITHDPERGMDVHALARRIARRPHPNLDYIVSDGEIASRRSRWQWLTYTGSNPHGGHAHFAVGGGPDSEPTPPYDDMTPWGVAPEQEEDEMTDEDRKLLKELLNLAKLSRVSEIAFSYDRERDWMQKRGASDTELSELAVDKVQAITDERKRLGL